MERHDRHPDRGGVVDDAALQQYVEIVFDAMLRDGVI